MQKNVKKIDLDAINKNIERLFLMQCSINSAVILSCKSLEKRVNRLENMVEALADDMFEQGITDPEIEGLSGLSWGEKSES